MCLKQPCDERCPYEEEDSVHHCQLCGKSVRVGEFYLEMGGDYYHRNCVEELDTGDWLLLVDTVVEVAG